MDPVLQFSFIWEANENTSSRHEGGLSQKMQREESQRLDFGSSFFFLLPLSLPYVSQANQEAVCFT